MSVNDYEARVFKYLTDIPAGTIKELKDVQEKERFITACKIFIDQTGKAEFNSTYTKVRKIN